MGFAHLQLQPLKPANVFDLPHTDTIATCHHDAIMTLDDAPRIFHRPPAFLIEDPKHYGYGDPMRTSLDVYNGQRFAMVLHDVLLVGHRWLITRDGRIYSDVNDFTPRLHEMAGSEEPHTNEHSGIRALDDGFTTSKLNIPAVTIDQPCFHFTGAEPFNFGFWLTKILPKFRIGERLGINTLPALGFAPFEWHQKLLSLFGVNQPLIQQDLNQIYHLRKVFVVGNLNTSFALDGESLQAYDAITSRLGGQDEAKVLYIARLRQGVKNPNYRLFVNEQMLADQLSAAGVRILEPEHVPMENAIRAFHHAKLIIGPSGAGMFNCVFSNPAAKVISFEAFPYWLQGHANLFASRGMDYGFIIGEADENDPTPIQKRWVLDTQHSMNVMRPFIEEALK